MKRFAWALVFLFAVTPAFAAKTITVGQLEDLLRSLKHDNKNDAEVATALKQIELSEELTVGTMNSLVSYVPGPLSTEQIFVLEALSANLIPPSADLPTDPAPDTATQHAMLAKAEAYVNGTYNQLPALTATRTTLRFQDNVEALSASSGLQGGAKDVVTSPGFSKPTAYIHYINSTTSTAMSNRGVEKLQAEEKKIPWGANRMIALEVPDPNLGTVLKEAQAAGSLKWLRWELVNGKKAAVYSFEVPEKESRLAVNVCCFPKINQAGVATFYTATTAATLGGGGSGGGVTGNWQTHTEWNNFKATVPYHGRLFVNLDTGIVVRLIVESELKASDFVHQLDTRIDYGAVEVGDKLMVAPVKTIVNTEVVPNGDSGAGGYTTRRTLFTSEYKGYRLGKK